MTGDRQVARSRLVVIGGSAAGARAAQTATTFDGDWQIDVISADPDAPYYRPGLSKQLLQGVWDADRAAQPAPSADLVTWHRGMTATAVDTDQRQVRLDNGDGLPFDRLVIASGCRPRQLSSVHTSTPATRAQRLFEVARISDAIEIRRLLAGGGHALVIGAGLIGSEVASSLAATGTQVTMIEPSMTPLARALGPLGDQVCRAWHDASTVDLRLGSTVETVTEMDDRIEVRLSGDEVLTGDIAISCIGVAPDTDWLSSSGIPLDLSGAIRCDENLLVHGFENIAAAGDIAAWDSTRTGQPTRVEHWLTAVEQGARAVRNVCAVASDREPFAELPMFWTEQHGHLVHFVGHQLPQADWSVVEGAPDDQQFVAAASHRGVTTGYLLVDLARRLGHYRQELTLSSSSIG